jgi:hypothetical protein
LLRHGHLAGHPNPDPQRVTRQIGKWHVFYIDRLQARAIGARGDRPFRGLRLGQRDCLAAGKIAIDLICLAADLRNRRPVD